MTTQKSFKIIFTGETKVGKSSIISQYALGIFDPQILQSLTSQYITREIKLSDNSLVTVDIWDVAGDIKYRSLSKIFAKDAKAIILTYDITDENTFKELKDFWYNTHKDFGAILFVVANKCDLENKKVKDEEGEEFAKSIGASFFSVSAKDNIGISNLFEKIAEALRH